MQAIFITGGASGIGQAIAKRFAAEGWRVGLADVDASGLAATAAMLPGGAETYVMDVRDRDAWAASLDDFTGKTGRLDVLANNAGIPLGGPLAEAALEDIDRTIAINLTGVINGARIGHAYLKRTPGSCLLNTASASAIYGSAGLAIYSSTKFGVRALTEALDGEWARDGIRVRGLVPAFIDTPLLAHPTAGSNRSIRETVTGAGLELSPVEDAAEAAWRLVHGDALFAYVGKTAHRLRFAARWMPGRLRKLSRKRFG
ncbi:short-chain dehydrogenase [Sphingomonas sp. Leaf33]|uniref:SDR family oxidoreductase n=1 Tax=Sphingomonas sp. Leaf33 TaxID=1736215 RepID=UPI0006FC7113|nr:SDR family oxidoreductase [Sphingomonas sp. Leaf33]KQN19358.1 short-chain dehydrogenase [Sphingomonas sp. Leaf33]